MFQYPIAVTIDTNILDAAKYDLSEGSTLQLLKKYVDDGTIKVVLSNIVVRESKKHLAKQVKKVCSIARNMRTDVLKESTEHLINHLGLNRLLEITKDKDSLVKKSEELFDNFIKEINAEILGTDLINLDRIIDDYFEINPPFENSEKKRKEFPDAFIAEQLRKRFSETEDVAIVSNDKGFKSACKDIQNHSLFSSLGELFDAINKEKEEYTETISILKELQLHICSSVLEYIESNENIDVIGLSYDKDGIVSGYDYDECYLQNVSDVLFKVHSVDELSEKTSKVTLICKAKIAVDCCYEDYANAPWDSETKEYVFVDTIKMREEHNAKFGCRVEVDREAKTFRIFPFTVILNSDSRTERYEIEQQPFWDYEQEVEDMDREYLGFIPLDSYESYLEEDLPNSELTNKIIKRFEIINNLYRKFEDFSIIYDSLLEELNSIEPQKIIKLIYSKMSAISDIPHIIDVENIEDSEIKEIINWTKTKCENASKISEDNELPDSLHYGESVVIKGVDSKEITFTIDELEIMPIKGSEDIIEIHLYNSDDKPINGYIKLTVGYLDFDEDGGAADGLEDAIEYEFYEIIQEIDSFISEQNQLAEKEAKIIEIIETALNNN